MTWGKCCAEVLRTHNVFITKRTHVLFTGLHKLLYLLALQCVLNWFRMPNTRILLSTGSIHVVKRRHHVPWWGKLSCKGFGNYVFSLSSPIVGIVWKNVPKASWQDVRSMKPHSLEGKRSKLLTWSIQNIYQNIRRRPSICIWLDELLSPASCHRMMVLFGDLMLFYCGSPRLSNPLPFIDWLYGR